MNYVYAGMWFLVGLILIFRMGRENKIFYFAGAFFLLLGGWWLLDALLAVDMFAGAWGIGLRIITAAALLVLCLTFFQEKRANDAKNKEKPKDDDQEADQ